MAQTLKYGICRVSVAPLRKTPSDRSEMVSQLLFCELVQILSSKGKSWLEVRCEFDDYEAWMDPKQLIMIPQADFEGLKQNCSYALELLQPAMSFDTAIPITAGANLPNFDGLSFKSPFGKFQYSGQVINAKEHAGSAELLINIAKKYHHAPYLWGGRSPFGIDCSGFIQVIFKMIGIPLPRDAKDQAKHGELIDFVTEVQAGDLAFFQNKEGNIHHVGIMLEQGRVLHASGKVRIDPLDHLGIYNLELRKYTHKLRFIKRLPLIREASPENPEPASNHH